MKKDFQTTDDNLAGSSFELSDILTAIARDEAEANSGVQFEADEDFVTDRLRAEFVAQVRNVMKEKKIRSSAGLAKLTGISRARVGAILQEKGNISLRTIAKIARALDTQVTLHLGNFSVKDSPANYDSLRDDAGYPQGNYAGYKVMEKP